MNELDYHLIINMIVGMAITEAVLKPIVVRYTRKMLKWLDRAPLNWIPDWLHTNPPSD
jgi:hypothetical protein